MSKIYLCCRHIHGRYDRGAHMMCCSLLLLTSTHIHTFVSRFACFHYQHRKQTSESADRRAHRCCIVKLRTALDVHKFAKCYHGRRWIKLCKSGSHGEGSSNEIELSMKCSISAFQGSAEQKPPVSEAEQEGGPDALAPAYRRCVPVYIPSSVFRDLVVEEGPFSEAADGLGNGMRFPAKVSFSCCVSVHRNLYSKRLHHVKHSRRDSLFKWNLHVLGCCPSNPQPKEQIAYDPISCY